MHAPDPRLHSVGINLEKIASRNEATAKSPL